MFFFALTFLAIFIQGLFASFEMASLSLSRFRLEFLSHTGNKNARWLVSFLENPTRFFGCILIGINAALLVGSECSRMFYEAIGLDPDWAPITQVILVMVFAELSPMFAARKHPSQIALFLTPFMKVMDVILLPFSFVLGFVSKILNMFLGQKKGTSLLFTREEISLALQEGSEALDESNLLMERIFQSKNMLASQVMTPIDVLICFPLHVTKAQVRKSLKEKYSPLIGLYQGHNKQLSFIVNVRDLLRLKDHEEVMEKAEAPWFVPEQASLIETLHQFRLNHKNIAITLDKFGKPSGIITLESIVLKLFGTPSKGWIEPFLTRFVKRTLNADMTLEAFDLEFSSEFSKLGYRDIEEMMIQTLGHLPVKGEVVKIGMFVFTVLEPRIRGISSVSVESIID